MSLYRVTPDKLEAVPETIFSAESLRERQDIQRLLKKDISILGDDLMVIAEEYGNWEESNRRIDLLCLAQDASLVIVEIKRSEDGGHMELQALRYAAMISSMTLAQVIHAHRENSGLDQEAAESTILAFLGGNSEDEPALSGVVRIILVSADFSTEVTTTVLWLNRSGLDITCIRISPYRLETQVLIDVSQIIPLPEAADYEVRIRAQEIEKQKLSDRQMTVRKFWDQLIERSRPRTTLLLNKTSSSEHWIPINLGRNGFSLTMVLSKESSRVEIFIHLPGETRNDTAFNLLLAKRAEIEGSFGQSLDWQPMPGKHSCRICTTIVGGWKTPSVEWPRLQEEIISKLILMEIAFKKPIQELVIP